MLLLIGYDKDTGDSVDGRFVCPVCADPGMTGGFLGLGPQNSGVFPGTSVHRSSQVLPGARVWGSQGDTCAGKNDPCRLCQASLSPLATWPVFHQWRARVRVASMVSPHFLLFSKRHLVNKAQDTAAKS